MTDMFQLLTRGQYPSKNNSRKMAPGCARGEACRARLEVEWIEPANVSVSGVGLGI